MEWAWEWVDRDLTIVQTDLWEVVVEWEEAWDMVVVEDEETLKVHIYVAGPVPRSKCVPKYLFRIPGI